MVNIREMDLNVNKGYGHVLMTPVMEELFFTVSYSESAVNLHLIHSFLLR